MKHHYSTYLFALILLASCAANPIRIVYDNDVHCELKGYALLAGVRDSLAAIDAANTAVVSSGDYLQGGTLGSISKGKYCIDAINAVGYDALALGNHEFDYQIPRMMSLLTDSLKAPVTCSNLYDIRTNPHQQVLPSYIIRDFSHHRRVAFVGVTTPCAMLDESYAFYSSGALQYTLCPDSFFVLVQRAVDAARREGATHVVLLSHMGDEEARLRQFTATSLVAATTGVDVVLDGHSHAVIPNQWIPDKNGQPVLLSQTGTKVANVGVLTIDTDNDTIYTQLLPATSCPKSTAVQHVLDSISTIVQPILSEVIGHSDFSLTINNPSTGKRAIRNAETNLGDLIADAFRLTQGTQLSIQNGGGIRTDIKAGDITCGDVIDVLTFCNMLGTYYVTGQMMLDFLEEAYKDLPKESNALQISGMKLRLDTTQHPIISYNPADSTVTITGKRRVYDVQVLQSDSTYLPVNPEQIYSLAATDYLVFQLDMHSLLKCQVIQTNIKEDYAVLKQFIQNDLHGVIPDAYRNPYGQGRVVMAPPTDM